MEGRRKSFPRQPEAAGSEGGQRCRMAEEGRQGREGELDDAEGGATAADFLTAPLHEGTGLAGADGDSRNVCPPAAWRRMKENPWDWEEEEEKEKKEARAAPAVTRCSKDAGWNSLPVSHSASVCLALPRMAGASRLNGNLPSPPHLPPDGAEPSSLSDPRPPVARQSWKSSLSRPPVSGLHATGPFPSHHPGSSHASLASDHRRSTTRYVQATARRGRRKESLSHHHQLT